MNEYKKWHSLKASINTQERVFFHEREIWFSSIGVNVGYEQDGKHQYFERPILIYKKFNHCVFWGIPITSALKNGPYYFHLSYPKKRNVLILSQLRLLDGNVYYERWGRCLLLRWKLSNFR